MYVCNLNYGICSLKDICISLYIQHTCIAANAMTVSYVQCGVPHFIFSIIIKFTISNYSSSAVQWNFSHNLNAYMPRIVLLIKVASNNCIIMYFTYRIT